jgi:hypothetical protein
VECIYDSVFIDVINHPSASEKNMLMMKNLILIIAYQPLISDKTGKKER